MSLAEAIDKYNEAIEVRNKCFNALRVAQDAYNIACLAIKDVELTVASEIGKANMTTGHVFKVGEQYYQIDGVDVSRVTLSKINVRTFT